MKFDNGEANPPSPIPGGGPTGNGMVAWSRPTAFGSSEFFFIEDNYMTTPGSFCNINDGDVGMRNCIRYNELGEVAIANHGTEDNRGGRAMEAYGNNWHFEMGNGQHAVGGIRSGQFMFWGNTTRAGAFGGLSTPGVGSISGISLSRATAGRPD